MENRPPPAHDELIQRAPARPDGGDDGAAARRAPGAGGGPAVGGGQHVRGDP